MIIRDLDHCELDAQVNKFEEIAGGDAVVQAYFNTLAQGFNAGVASTFDAIAIKSGTLSLAGYSYSVLMVAE